MSEKKVKIYVQSIFGANRKMLALDIINNNIKVKDLIQLVVYQEVEAYNQILSEPSESFHCNGISPIQKKDFDHEQQYYLALNAFKKKDFLLLADNKQYFDLEEEIIVYSNLYVNFIRLIPLISG